ncbi:guanine nucleotide binding protein, alpha subunit [Obelidium mucronatum]|nr:guanine nucleotide binding protein, alpha subunit [Obelidium mucronatum]
MGNCESSPESTAALVASKHIDNLIKEDMKGMENTIKLLLLGAGETGKSTVLKQIKLIYGKGFEAEEKKVFRSAVLGNIMTCIKTLAIEMDKLKIPFGFKKSRNNIVNDNNSNSNNNSSSEERLSGESGGGGDGGGEDSGSPISKEGVGFSSSGSSGGGAGQDTSGSKSSLTDLNATAPTRISADPYAKLAEQEYEKAGGKKQTGAVADASRLVRKNVIMLLTSEGFVLDDSIIDAIKVLWADSGIQYCYSRSNEFHLLDCCAIYLNDVDRICASDYIPTDQDILHTRIMTTNITETKVQIEEMTFRIFDVGGQRSERKKWAPYFDDVNAIIFLVAISSYDQVCTEDNVTNRITEAHNLFGSICNHPIFKNTAIVLFLNKIDLFKEKVARFPISTYFPKYKGPNDYTTGKEFFGTMFMSINKYPDRKIYVHFTWATDTKQTRKVLETVNKIIMNANLQEAGI